MQYETLHRERKQELRTQMRFSAKQRSFHSYVSHASSKKVSDVDRLVRVRKVFHRAKASDKDRCRLLSFITRTAMLFVITPQPTQRSIPARP